MPLRPLTARSAVLSLLLGAHPPELPVRQLVRAAALFEISETTLRVALTRMVATGDLRRDGTTYALSDRLLARQRLQDESVSPHTRKWDGGWEIGVVTVTGRSATERAHLRTRLAELRLAELREGVWLRPANLSRPWPDDVTPVVERFTGAPGGDPAEIAGRLWDLPAWASTATDLLKEFTSTDHPATRLTAAAGMVRHLVADPVLPEELLPGGWPGAELRAAYRGYQEELIALAQDLHRG